MNDDGGLSFHITGVAQRLWGKPHSKSPNEWRFGEGRTINPRKGTFFDHAAEQGGGVIDLVARETGLKGREAVRWLNENGFRVEERQMEQAHSYTSHGKPAQRSAYRREPPPPPPQEERDEPRKEKREPQGKRAVAQTWQYVSEEGAPLFEVVRFQFRLPDGEWERGDDGKVLKDYRQRRPAQPGEESRDGWVYSVKDVRLVPYRLPELIEARNDGRKIMLVEGEKAADRLWDEGIPATTGPMGAGKFDDALVEWFAGADVVILPDNDKVGRDHRDLVGGKLRRTANSVSVLDLPNLPPKGDAWDWIEAGGTADQFYALIEKNARPWAPGVPASQFGAIRWCDLDEKGPEHEWLIKGILTRGERSICAGPSGSGKSFLVTDMALAVTRGIPYAGRKTRRGLVIYQAGEGGRGLKKRLRAYRLKHGLKAREDLPFVLLPSPVDLYGGDDDTNLLIADIKAWALTYDVPLELVVIDTLSAATPGANENASEDISKVLARIARIAAECNCHVMLVHHLNAQGSRMRGHSSLGANVENVIMVDKTEQRDDDKRIIRTATISKQKDGDDGLSWKFVLPAIEIGRDEDDDPITSCVVAPPRFGDVEDGEASATAARERGFALRTNREQVVMQALFDAMRAAGEVPPPIAQAPEGVLAINYREWSRRYAEIDPDVPDANDEAEMSKARERRKKALQDIGGKLMKFGVIGRNNPYVWFTGRPVRGFDLSEFTRRPAPSDHDRPAASGGADDDLPF